MLPTDIAGTRRTVDVTRVATTNGFTWRIVFTSHLDSWSPSLLSVDGSALTGAGDESITITTEATTGTYPVSYTPWVSGEYDVFVQANGVDILDSPFALTVAIGDVKAGASTSVGDGLVGGIAGDTFAFEIQAKDQRKYDEQTIFVNTNNVQSVAEVQTITCDGSNTPTTDSFELTFRGETVTINGNMIGSDIKDALEGLDAIPSVDVTIAGGATACASSNPPDIEITFTGLDGDVPEFVVSSKSGPDSVQVIESVMGVAPAVKEVQYFTCQGTTGTVTLDFTSIENVYGATFGHGTGSVTIDAADTYNDLQATLDAVFGSGTITVSRPDGGSLSVSVCTNGASRDVHLTFRSGTGDVSEAWLTPSSHTLQRSNGNSGSFTSGERVQGVSAAWGNFVVSFEGKSTSPIDARPRSGRRGCTRAPRRYWRCICHAERCRQRCFW